MKIALITLILILSSNLFAGTFSLSYRDSVELKKTTLKRDLPVNLLKLYRAVSIDDKRMIAGKFEISAKREKKKTYLDGLRSRLNGSKGIARF